MKGIAWMSTAFLLAALIGQWLGGRLIVESIAMSMWLFAALYLIAVFLNTLLPTQEKIGPGEQVAEHSPPRFIDVAISTLTNIQLLRLYLIAWRYSAALSPSIRILLTTKTWHYLPG